MNGCLELVILKNVLSVRLVIGIVKREVSNMEEEQNRQEQKRQKNAFEEMEDNMNSMMRDFEDSFDFGW